MLLLDKAVDLKGSQIINPHRYQRVLWQRRFMAISILLGLLSIILFIWAVLRPDWAIIDFVNKDFEHVHVELGVWGEWRTVNTTNTRNCYSFNNGFLAEWISHFPAPPSNLYIRLAGVNLKHFYRAQAAFCIIALIFMLFTNGMAFYSLGHHRYMYKRLVACLYICTAMCIVATVEILHNSVDEWNVEVAQKSIDSDWNYSMEKRSGWAVLLAHIVVGVYVLAGIVFAIGSRKQKGMDAATAEFEIEDRPVHIIIGQCPQGTIPTLGTNPKPNQGRLSALGKADKKESTTNKPSTNGANQDKNKQTKTTSMPPPPPDKMPPKSTKPDKLPPSTDKTQNEKKESENEVKNEPKKKEENSKGSKSPTTTTEKPETTTEQTEKENEKMTNNLNKKATCEDHLILCAQYSSFCQGSKYTKCMQAHCPLTCGFCQQGDPVKPKKQIIMLPQPDNPPLPLNSDGTRQLLVIDPDNPTGPPIVIPKIPFGFEVIPLISSTENQGLQISLEEQTSIKNGQITGGSTHVITKDGTQTGKIQVAQTGENSEKENDITLINPKTGKKEQITTKTEKIKNSGDKKSEDEQESHVITDPKTGKQEISTTTKPK